MKKQEHLTFFLGMVLIAATGSLKAQSSEPSIHPTGGLPPWPVGGEAQLVAHVDPNQKLRLALGLEPPHPDEEQQLIHDLQDRKSPHFHHFLTAAEWNERFAPSAANEQAVLAWAENQGLTITNRFPNRLVVDVEGPVAAIEKAVNVSINRYAMGEKTFFSNDRAPSIPASLGGILHSVIGLNDYQVLKSANHFSLEPQGEPENVMYSAGLTVSAGPSGQANGDATKLPANLSAVNGAYTPANIYSSYGYDAIALNHLGHCCNPLGNANVTPPESSIAIATFGYNNESDIAGFQTTYPYLSYHYQMYYVDGTPTHFDGEGTLDLEWATAMANSFGAYQNTAMIYLYEGGTNQSSTWTDIFNQILTDGYARVFENSHYCDENNCNDTGTMDTQHEIFGAMVAQGWTLIAISGDYGATSDCQTVSVAWPGDDPYMLTVGGTKLRLKEGTPLDPTEVAWTGGTASGSCSSNDGGSGGGCSKVFAAPDYQQQNPACGASSRSVPDLALNADPNASQTVYVQGLLSDVFGTSIAGPEMAGFFAQENAYLLYIGAVMGPDCNGLTPCAPLGQPNQVIYDEGFNAFAPHYPFYDITMGCNSNDVTIANELSAYCAATGYDLVTGWGSVNMLQLAWLFNTAIADDFGPPTITFQGPTIGQWYNSDQGVFWLAKDTSATGLPPNGLAGFTGKWDVDPGDVYRDFTESCCDSYQSGPQVTTTDLGDTFVSAAGQGCHTVHVRAWDNAGLASADSTYGPVCYDTVPPVTTAQLSGTISKGVYTGPVKVTLKATDATSGVQSTVYQIGSGLWILYTAPFTVSGTGDYTISFYSTDNASNKEAVKKVNIPIGDQTTTQLRSLLNPGVYREDVQFTATVTPMSGGPATGSITLKDGVSPIATTTLASGKASFTVTLTTGTHSMTAVYGGNTSFASSTSAVLTESVDKAATTTKIGSSLDPSTVGTSVTFSAVTVGAYGGVPTGKVVFKNGTHIMGTVAIECSDPPLPGGHCIGYVAKFTTSIPLPGTYSITATYLGDNNFEPSVSEVLKQVVQ